MVKNFFRKRWESLILIILFIIVSNFSYCQITVEILGTNELNFGSFVATGSGSITLNPTSNSRLQADQVVVIPSSSFNLISARVYRGSSGTGGAKPVTLSFAYTSNTLGPNVTFVFIQPQFSLAKNSNTTILIGGILTVSGPVTPGEYKSGIVTITGSI